MLERMRQWARTFIWIDFPFSLAWYSLAAAAALATLLLVAIRGEYDEVPTLLGTFAAAAAFLAFIGWIARDARQAAKRLRQQRLKATTPADAHEERRADTTPGY